MAMILLFAAIAFGFFGIQEMGWAFLTAAFGGKIGQKFIEKPKNKENNTKS